MRVPKFLKIIPEEYVADSYEPTEFDLENATKEHPTVKAANLPDRTFAYFENLDKNES